MESTEALLILGHGSHLNPGSSVPTREHADALRRRGVFDEVGVAFWKEEPSFREVLRTLDADRVYAVPFFMAEGYFVDEVIPRELRLPQERVVYTEPAGTHPSMTDVIAERARSVYGGDAEPDENVALAVVGHGTERNPKSAESALGHVERIRDRAAFAEVSALFMDEPPYVDDVTAQFDSDEIVVVPFFSSDGYHTQEDIPEDMGIVDRDADPSGYTVPARTDDKRVWYTGAVGTEPGIAGVLAERAEDARREGDERGGGGVTATTTLSGVREDAESWFVGWLEDGARVDESPTGARRSWGELVLTSHTNGYDVRHADDTGTPAEELDVYEDPTEARELAKFDDDGEYRPMNGETTLPTGWVFPSLDSDDLAEVVRRVYPASVENAYLESRGELDVTHWDETSERQTGMYADTEELTGDALRCATDAFCASRCVKRRVWEESEDVRIDSAKERGKGVPVPRGVFALRLGRARVREARKRA